MKQNSFDTSSSQYSSHGPVKTTFGELCEAVTEVALKAGKTQEEGLQLASLALEDMLRRSNKKSMSFS